MTPALPEGTNLVQLQAWLGRRDKALEARSQLKQAERDLREAEADIGAACTTLSAALDALAVPYEADAGFDALLAAAQSAIDSETELKALRAAVQDRERELKSRERAFEKASEAERGWQAAWAETCSACWLGEGGENLSVAAVREILVALADLGPAIEKQRRPRRPHQEDGKRPGRLRRGGHRDCARAGPRSGGRECAGPGSPDQ